MLYRRYRRREGAAAARRNTTRTMHTPSTNLPSPVHVRYRLDRKTSFLDRDKKLDRELDREYNRELLADIHETKALLRGREGNDVVIVKVKDRARDRAEQERKEILNRKEAQQQVEKIKRMIKFSSTPGMKTALQMKLDRLTNTA